MVSSSPFMNAHSDVIDAKPFTDEEKAGLVAEIKERAKKAFAKKEMPVCEALYSKAITVASDAPLRANRSAVRLAMGKAADAKADASEAVKHDAAYSKGYYRLGQACESLREYAEAIAAFESGAALEPTSKVWPAAVAKADKAREEWESRPAPAPAADTARIEQYAVSDRLKEQMAAAKDQPKKPKADGASDLRGYKMDSQGRKTTFFNNELDAETKALIGDIAPKKVEAEVKMAVVEGASSWNQSGTFEQKDHTKWARAWLERKIEEGFMVDLPDRAVAPGGLTVPHFLTVKKLKDFKGDASVTLARGKKKWMLDLAFALEWEFALDDKGARATGSVLFPDITCDTVDEGEPLEQQLEVDPLTPPEAKHLINSHVKGESQGLRPAVRTLCAELVAEFRKTK